MIQNAYTFFDYFLSRWWWKYNDKKNRHAFFLDISFVLQKVKTLKYFLCIRFIAPLSFIWKNVVLRLKWTFTKYHYFAIKITALGHDLNCMKFLYFPKLKTRLSVNFTLKIIVEKLLYSWTIFPLSTDLSITFFPPRGQKMQLKSMNERITRKKLLKMSKKKKEQVTRLKLVCCFLLVLVFTLEIFQFFPTFSKRHKGR